LFRWSTVTVPLLTFVLRSATLGSLYQVVEVGIHLRHGFARKVDLVLEKEEGDEADAGVDAYNRLYLWARVKEHRGQGPV
jgi:hypothetical protein